MKGALAASAPIRLSIALRPRDPAGLQAFATAVSTPGSPQFRHFLSVAQFASRYGATDAAIAAVVATLRSDGLTVAAPTANHLMLRASGTAAVVQRAFATQLSTVTLASGRVAYSNTSAPALPPAVAADVQGVVGLNDLVTEHPEGLAPAQPLAPAERSSSANVTTGGTQPCSAATAVTNQFGGYTADVIADAYGFNSLYGLPVPDLGAGQTIALYELEPYNPTDVSTYQACYGTSTSITNVPVDGPPAYVSGDDDMEAALDIEQLIGLVPDANIIVYQAPNTSAGAIDEYTQIVSQDRAKVISSSWGECEAALLTNDPAAVKTENTLFQEAAAQGQSLYVASGDAGSAACVQSNSSDTGLAVSDPAAQPFATGVGGTTLYTVSLDGTTTFWTPGNPVDQSVWNDGTDFQPTGSATGGGISKVWPMPPYQSGAAASVGVINSDSSSTACGQTAPTLCREVPDVSADGDPVTGYAVFATAPPAAPGWEVVAGTSAAAPLWAAFTGLVNADSSCRGQPVGFVNPALYQIAGTAYASNISDVTLASPIASQFSTQPANNDALGVNGGMFPVGPGYDMATGLGTPIAANLAASLCALASPVYTVGVTNPGAQSGTVGSPENLQIQATDSGGLPVTYTATGLPAGMSINSSGLISGTPTTPGTATVTVSASDKFTNSGTAQFTWTVAAPPPPPTTTTTAPPPPPPPPVGHPKITSVSLTGVARGKPKLKFTVNAGSNAPALKVISIGLPSGLKFSKKLKKGVSAPAGFKDRLQAGKLTMTLRSAVRRATITLAGPALTASAPAATKARDHKLGKLKLTVGTTDASNKRLTATVTLSDKG